MKKSKVFPLLLLPNKESFMTVGELIQKLSHSNTMAQVVIDAHDDTLRHIESINVASNKNMPLVIITKK